MQRCSNSNWSCSKIWSFFPNHPHVLLNTTKVEEKCKGAPTQIEHAPKFDHFFDFFKFSDFFGFFRIFFDFFGIFRNLGIFSDFFGFFGIFRIFRIFRIFWNFRNFRNNLEFFGNSSASLDLPKTIVPLCFGHLTFFNRKIQYRIISITEYWFGQVSYRYRIRFFWSNGYRYRILFHLE